MITTQKTPDLRPDPATVNISTWGGGGFVRYYAHRQLRPVEVVLLLRYHEQFRGRILELGCGAGRFMGYLVGVAQELYGIELSADMIAESRARFPAATFLEGDMRDLSRFDDGSLDVVFGGCNIFDIFGDQERRAMLREVRRVLCDDGLLIMSAHNRAHLPEMPAPTELATGNPLRVARDAVRIPRRMWRHRRLSALEHAEPDYAIVNNSAHEFALLHYFIERDAQFRQLEEEGYSPVACLDLDGREVPAGELAPYCLELHYIARKD